MSETKNKIRTLYVPQMAPVHFPLLSAALEMFGYDVKLLCEVSDRAVDLGLHYVNNDACYPAIVVIGQLLETALSPEFDKETSAFILTQTCGPCRATNYPTLLKWAFEDAGVGSVPILTLSRLHLEGQPHLPIGVASLRLLCMALLMGDTMQRLWLSLRTYANSKESAQTFLTVWTRKGKEALRSRSISKCLDLCKRMTADYANIPRTAETKPRVGIVGEILVKYHPKANQKLIDQILAEGAEPRIGDITIFVLYCLFDSIFQSRTFGKERTGAAVSHILIWMIERWRNSINHALKKAGMPQFETLAELQSRVRGIVSLGQEAGEGWLLSAEMIDYICTDTPNVLCLQPFACLPNHITGRGVMRHVMEHWPQANVCGIDFEAGTSEANVSNRLKLFMSQARDKF